MLDWNRMSRSELFYRGVSAIIIRKIVVSKANDYRQQAEEAAARVDCRERKLAFERKRRKRR
jgi:hypothetical protein